MSSCEFSEKTVGAFEAAEAALTAGHSLESVIGSFLIVPCDSAPGTYDFVGASLYSGSAGTCWYEVARDGSTQTHTGCIPTPGGYVVECWYRKDCGGGSPPAVIYTVACQTLVEVAQVFMFDSAQDYEGRCWDILERGRPTDRSPAPRLAAALHPSSRPHALVRCYGRQRIESSVAHLCSQAWKAAGPAREAHAWETTETLFSINCVDSNTGTSSSAAADYSVADLVGIKTYVEGLAGTLAFAAAKPAMQVLAELTAVPTSIHWSAIETASKEIAAAVLAQPQATWPACLRRAFDAYSPVLTNPL